MNGKIRFSSTLGEGSCFFIELDTCDIPTQVIDEFPPDKKVEMPTALETEKYQVLYIEDNPLNQEVLFKLLTEREDIEILTAPLGRLGLELAQEHHPDLILMDIDLPDINGFDVFRCLQGLDATKHIPVVALSAHAMKDTIEKAKDLGFKDYLTKPVDVDLFFSTLDLYLKK